MGGQYANAVVGDQGLRPILLRMLEGRVGSTLVMQLLGTSPAVAFDRVYPFEHSYLTYLTRLAGQIGAPLDAGMDMADVVYGDGHRVGRLPFDPQVVDRTELARAGLAGLWAAFSATVVATAPAARFYAEKFWGEVGPVADAGLDPIVIDLVRDPRDVIVSIRAFNDKTGVARFGRSNARDDEQHLRRLATGMRLRLAEFARPVAGEHLMLRYEDLVADLPGQARRLEEALGVAFEPETVQQVRDGMAFHMTSESPEASVGRWAGTLTAGEARVIEGALGSRMAELGYAPS
jgi:hypothetical protein